MADPYEELVHELTADPDTVAAQMMGMPALKVGSKMFGGRSGDELVVKLGRERADELIGAGKASPFDPSGRGRPMKDWAMVAEGAGDWLALAEEARRFVASADP